MNRIIFTGGQVFDGTGAPPVPADVVVRGDRVPGIVRRSRRVPADGYTGGSCTLTTAERPPCTTASASFSTWGSSPTSDTVTP